MRQAQFFKGFILNCVGARRWFKNMLCIFIGIATLSFELIIKVELKLIPIIRFDFSLDYFCGDYKYEAKITLWNSPAWHKMECQPIAIGAHSKSWNAKMKDYTLEEQGDERLERWCTASARTTPPKSNVRKAPCCFENV
jgi:hypothetical protein